MSILSVLASVVKVAVSQDNMDDEIYDMMYEEDNMTNNCSLSMENPNINCTNLPADGMCLNCAFDFDCNYGMNTTVSCMVPDDVECSVSHLQCSSAVAM